MLSKPVAVEKPEPIKRTKARQRRLETAVKHLVRALVVARDGDCRLAGVTGFGACCGASQWAHLEEKRRARTRGMDPWERHSTRGTAMLCDAHHRRYDRYGIAVEFLTHDRADGRMTWSTRDTRYTESAL